MQPLGGAVGLSSPERSSPDGSKMMRSCSSLLIGRKSGEPAVTTGSRLTSRGGASPSACIKTQRQIKSKGKTMKRLNINFMFWLVTHSGWEAQRDRGEAEVGLSSVSQQQLLCLTINTCY